jgi:hypothetical protein
MEWKMRGRHDRASRSMNNPAKTSAECKRVGARSDAAQREAKRERVFRQPATLLHQLTVQCRGSGAATAKRQVRISRENDSELCETWHSVTDTAMIAGFKTAFCP